MFKFCVSPGVNSKVASHFDFPELYTRTIPFASPPDISISAKPPNVPAPPEELDNTFIAF